MNNTYFYCANFSKIQCPAKLRVDFDHEESVIAVSSCGLHSEHCKTLGFENEESKSKVKDMLESLTGSGMLRPREIQLAIEASGIKLPRRQIYNILASITWLCIFILTTMHLYINHYAFLY